MQRVQLKIQVFPLLASRNQALPLTKCFLLLFLAVAPFRTDSSNNCSVSLTCQAFPGPPLLLFDNNHSSAVN